LRILLDENLDWRLGRDLPGHQVDSVPRLGWAGVTNGELIEGAEENFDILVTMDTGLANQQSVANRSIALVILRARPNRLADTRPLMPQLLAALETIAPGTITTIQR
jgi:predicted nuclease of predicted toxin-antitoxin system